MPAGRQEFFDEGGKREFIAIAMQRIQRLSRRSGKFLAYSSEL
jgi:hypothetical protein